MVTKLIIYLTLICAASSYFCFSQCITPTNASCNGSPYNCNAFDSLFLSLDTFNTGFTKVEMVRATGITAANNFKLTNTFAPSSCSIIYTTTSLTYTFDILGKFVSTDYIYKQYAIIQAHYQIRIRLSIAFVGVWASTDYLNLYTFDGTTKTNFPMRYSCTDSTVNYTEMLCNTRTGNNVDCVISFSFTLPHNSTYLLANISSLTNIKDSNIQYWSILDLNIATVDCDSSCASCYTSNLPSTCTSCATLNYLTGNTCSSTCVTQLLKLPNINALLGGFCVASCPPGYFVSGTSCSACATGCLTCTSATSCLLTVNSGSKTTLWQKLMPLWIVLIILATLLIIGVVWKCFFDKSTFERDRVERMVS
jgi:hypothetical protein